MEHLPFIPTTSDWLAFLPEITSVVLAIIFIILGAFKLSKNTLSYIAIACAFVLTALYVTIPFADFAEPTNPDGAYMGGMFGRAGLCWIFPLCAFLTSVMAIRYLGKLKEASAGEFFGILFASVAALSLFSRSMNLMSLFVSLETSAVCFYALIAWGRRCQANLEGSIRYLILSGVSGAFLLLGIAFAYGASFKEGLNLLFFNNFAEANSTLFYVGYALALVAVLFKLSAFPFQFWSPDVYSAAPTPVLAYLATASKSAALIVLFNILSYTPFSEKIEMVLCVSAVLGILIGSLGGLNEKKTKRIIAFSGITNAGYLMVLLASFYKIANSEPTEAAVGIILLSIVLFVISYVFAVYGVLFAQNLYKKEDDSALEISEYNSMRKNCPTAASTLVVALSSLAGIPPSAGFFAKLFILITAYMASLYALMFVLIAGSAASIYYYFKWIRASYIPMDEGKEFAFEKEGFLSPLMIAVSLVSLLAGVIFATMIF